MSLSFSGYQTQSARFQQDLEAGAGEVLGATARQTISELPLVSVYRMAELGNAQLAGQRIDAINARQRIADAGLDGRLTVGDEGMTSEALDILIDRKRNEIKRQEVLSRSPGGFALGAAQMGTAFAASLLDPLNVGLAFVPVVGEARYMRYLANARGLLGRTAVRAGVGAAEGAVGAALVEPLVYAAKTQEQADYDFTDSLLNVGFGTVFGGGLHASLGAGRELSENLTVYRPLSRGSRDTLRSAYYAAEVNKEHFDDQARAIAEEVGGEVKLPKLKGKERSVEKVVLDYGGDASKVSDLVRGTIVVDSIEQAQRALAAAERKFGSLQKLRNMIREDVTPTTPDGYRDIKANVSIGGRLYEIQINTREMLTAKKSAHPLYEKARTIMGKLEKEGRDPTDAERAELTQLQSAQREIYDAAWATSLRNSASETSVPLRTNESIGNRLPSGTSQARTVQFESDTGTPSTSAKRVPSGNFSGSMNHTSSEIIAQNASPRVRESALRAAVAQAVEGRQVVVDPIFSGDVDAARAVAQRGSDITADSRAATAADRQLADSTTTADLIAEHEQAIADQLAELKDTARIAGIEIDDDLAAFDELIADAETYGKAARAAALCGLGH